jgi:hypothetical protein
MEDIERLKSAYSTALTKLKSGKVGGSNGLERDYATAYDKLALAGGAQRLRRKYRP